MTSMIISAIYTHQGLK